jgi:hypothetical protein
MRCSRATLSTALALGLLAMVPANASATAPAVPFTTLSHVSTDSATLEADINPEGKASQYHFEYGLADCASNPCTSTPAPEGKLAKGEVPKRVEAPIEGLTPGTTYHFRVIAKNGKTPADLTAGPDRTFTTQSAPQTFDPCPNDALRDGPSAKLPDCRAYEQATPVEKNGGDAIGDINYVQASTGGDAIVYYNAAGLPGGTGSQDFPSYLSRRGAGGWSTQGILPPASFGAPVVLGGWTPDLSQVFVNVSEDGFLSDTGFFSRSSTDGSLATIYPYQPAGISPSTLAAASADGSKVFFQTHGQLDPAASPNTDNLYVWDRDTGTVSLAGVLPDSACATPPPCVPASGSFAGPYDWFRYAPGPPAGGVNYHFPGGITDRYYVQDEHAVSADGSKVYFTTADTGQIYLRENPTDPNASTVEVSASEKTNGPGDGTDAAGDRPAAFIGASADGSKAFFTSPEKLTNDATTGPEVTETPAIARADIEGGGKDLQFLPVKADGVTVFAGHIYWADPEGHAIGRAKLNGEDSATELKPEFITGAGTPHYVAVDSEHIYWSNAGDGKDGNGTIARADIDGSPGSVKLDFITGASNPQGVAVDGSHIYWANDGANGGNNCEAIPTPPTCGEIVHTTRAIGRANLDGTLPNQRFIEESQSSLKGIAIDAANIFLARNAQPGGVEGFGSAARYDLSSGKSTGQVYDPDQFDPAQAIPHVRGLALDGGHVYLAAQGSNAIGRNKSGFSSNTPEEEPEFIADAGHPKGLAVDTEHIYWSANQDIIPNPGNDLYRYDTDAGAGEHLSDLTVDTNPGDPNGAEVQGVLGISEDGSYVYLAANGDLDGAGPAVPGDCRHTNSRLSYSGICNLYLLHGGETTFIARLDASGRYHNDAVFGDAANWQPTTHVLTVGNEGEEMATARVSPDGRTLLFRSQEKLTSYDNEGVPQFYRYRIGEPTLRCVSCNPTGTPPSFAPSQRSIQPFIASTDPFNTTAVLLRNLSASGNQVFFESAEKLVAADTNGDHGCPRVGAEENLAPSCQDVYEWEAAGAGSCPPSAPSGGCLYLLSPGTGSTPSYFADASASGNDAFLFSRDPLVPQDQDGIQDIYDASMGGGLASQHQAPSPSCEAEGCKPAASPPPVSHSAGSASFSGPANPQAPRCPKGKRQVRAKGKARCVAKHHRRRHRNAKSTGRTSR